MCVQVPTSASLTSMKENNNVHMGDELKEVMGNEAEMDKIFPTIHGNECSMYELMRWATFHILSYLFSVH